MLTSKQRAYLRGIANRQNALFQIGKGGISDKMAEEISICLEKNELIKISVLETAFLSTRGACDEICKMTGADGVSCVGNKFVIYRESKDNKQIILP